ncbi:MAG: hypothetical protein RR710_08795 [Oscillospiraceae bacterium]
MTNPEVTDNKDYILSGAAPIDLIDILKTISLYLGKTTHFVNVPFWIAYSGACLVYGISLKKIDYREKVQRLVEPRTFPHSEATQDFGYSPMQFEDGLKKEVEDYLKSKAII